MQTYDLAVLAGVGGIKVPQSMDLNIYYLQKIGIDVWSLRDINSSKKVLVLIDMSSSSNEMTDGEQKLLTKMLSSIKLSMDGIELKIVTNMEEHRILLERNQLRNKSAIIVMGSKTWEWFKQDSDFYFENLHWFKNKAIFNICHPAELLKNPLQKKVAYSQLLELEKFIFNN